MTLARDSADLRSAATDRVMTEIATVLDSVLFDHVVPRAVCVDDSECSNTSLNLTSEIRAVVDRLAMTQARLREVETEGTALRMDSSRVREALLQASIAALQTSNDTLHQSASRDADSIQSLNAWIALLQRQQDSTRMSHDSVFVIAARREDLLRLGAVVQRGGVAGLGSILVPEANPPLDSSWSRILASRDSTFKLPRGDRWYRVVSTHPLSLLRADRVDGALLGGTLRIYDARTFWSASRFLILEEK
jgi:hypothetical protein